MKSLLLQRRQVAVTILQLAIPIAIISLIGGLQIVTDKYAGGSSSDEPEFYGKVLISATFPPLGAKYALGMIT